MIGLHPTAARRSESAVPCPRSAAPRISSVATRNPALRAKRAIYVGPGDEEVGDPGNELTRTARP